MVYDVYYKRKNGLFWHRIKRVKGDYSFYVKYEGLTITHPVRVIEQDDGARHEFPMSDYRFKFSKERYLLNKESFDRDAGK